MQTKILPLTGGMTKRCYVDGEIKVHCLKCNSVLVHDMRYGSDGDNYLGYPEQDILYHFDFHCETCEDNGGWLWIYVTSNY